MSDPHQSANDPHRLPPYVSQQPPSGYPGQPAPKSGNSVGRAGLILGLVGLVLGLLISFGIQFMIRNISYSVIGLISSVGGLLAFGCALAALILGMVGLKRVGAPQGQAGIAVGLGIAGVAAGILSFLINLLGVFLY